ncbi:peptidase C39 family protein [Alsobacter sp. SYSU BS001988]
MPQQSVIRPAELADLDALEAIENRVFETDRLSRRSLRYYIVTEKDALLVIDRRGTVVGYALVAFRRGAALARLYSIAILPEAAGGGLGRKLLEAVEAEAEKRGCLFLRLEVRADNVAAIRLYERAAYRRFGVYPDYYEDHQDALRYEKRLVQQAKLTQKPPPFYAQTLDFTCGPCCLMMALGWADPAFRATRAAEIRLWRESTTVYMTSGLGGCEPYGLAATLARHGLPVELRLSHKGPFFLDGVRDADKKEVMRIAQEDFRAEAAEAGVPIRLEPLDQASLAAVLDEGAIVIVLVSGYRMFRKKVPHWLLAHGHDGRHVFVNDPWVETAELETNIAAANLPIPAEEFQRMARYGKEDLRAAVIIRKPNR